MILPGEERTVAAILADLPGTGDVRLFAEKW
jgi:hypothetical protein